MPSLGAKEQAMSINAIQFQRGLSLPQFQALYGSEQQCERALVAARWPHGWQCAHCGCKRFFHTAMARADCCGSASSVATKAPALWAP